MGAIQARDLVRTYKTSTGMFRRRGVEVQAVRGVSFEVADGELFGLLGPNGAGKTTTIKMLITLLIPTSGSASVLGYDVVRDAREVRKRIGYVFGGDRGLYERLSALDNLRYFAELYAVPPAEQKRRIAELLDLVGLAGREKERVEGYSRGMRQRLHIARGLLHDPPVVFLDEPTIGVDPVGARELRRTIAGLTEAGKTVLLTTHYMFEADDLCDRMAVIAKGEIVAEGTPQRPEGDRRRPDGDRDRDVRSRRGRGRPRTPGGRGHLGLDRGARSGTGAARAVARGDRADPAAARVARHDPHRTCRGARADARGRVRGARRPGRMIRRGARLLGLGWLFHVKMLTRSSFNGVLGIVYPLFFATVAFFMYRAGNKEALFYASLGASVMGVWAATSTAAGGALQRERWHGTLELLVAAPAHFALVLLPVTIAMATIGLYSMVSTLIWGRVLFGIHVHIEHWLLFCLSVPATVMAIGMLGFLLAVSFVRYRTAWALGNLLEYPVWLICGFLVPLTLFPAWVRPISWVLAPTWGMQAIRESAQGGTPIPDLLVCVGLGLLYTAIGVVVVERFLNAARARAVLSLT